MTETTDFRLTMGIFLYSLLLALKLRKLIAAARTVIDVTMGGAIGTSRGSCGRIWHRF